MIKGGWDCRKLFRMLRRHSRLIIGITLMFAVIGSALKVLKSPQALGPPIKALLQQKYPELDFVYVDITNIPEEVFNDSPELSRAIANDGIDDSVAIQAVIDWLTVRREAGLTEKAIIYFPKGTFRFSHNS